MRKFLNIMAGIMLLAVSALLHGCKDDDGFILPYNLRMEDTTVQSGERLNIQGQGFSAGDALIFETLDAEYRFQAILEEGDITTDGISVTLPDNFVYEETYRIYLVRGLERAEIGGMKVSIGAMQQFRLMSSNIRVWTGDSGEPLDSPRRWGRTVARPWWRCTRTFSLTSSARRRLTSRNGIILRISWLLWAMTVWARL